jgi:hypothetical protein
MSVLFGYNSYKLGEVLCRKNRITSVCTPNFQTHAIKYSVYFMLFVYVVSPSVQYLSCSLRLPIRCKVIVIVKKMKYAVTTFNISSQYKTYFTAFSEGGGKLWPVS